jgi:hypothetical protein
MIYECKLSLQAFSWKTEGWCPMVDFYTADTLATKVVDSWEVRFVKKYIMMFHI